MSTTQNHEALRLAEKLRDMCSQFKTPSHEKGVVNGAIQELCRQHARIAELEDVADMAIKRIAELEAQQAKRDIPCDTCNKETS